MCGEYPDGDCPFGTRETWVGLVEGTIFLVVGEAKPQGKPESFLGEVRRKGTPYESR